MSLGLGVAALTVAIAAAGALVGAHGHLPPAGYAAFGVAAGLLLVGVSKLLAALGLQRRAPRESADD